jgi:hypothetical protein
VVNAKKFLNVANCLMVMAWRPTMAGAISVYSSSGCDGEYSCYSPKKYKRDCIGDLF